MRLSDFTDALKADLASLAELGDDSAAEAARRLTLALQASAGLRLLDALGAAAEEISGQLPSGRVEIRLTGQDPELVFVEDETSPAAGGDDAFTARITLRLPESLKLRIEAAATRESVSVNAWIVRALARGTAPGGRSGNRLTGYARS